MAVEIRINAKNVTRSVSYEQTILPLRLAESTVRKTSEKRTVKDVRTVQDLPLDPDAR